MGAERAFQVEEFLQRKKEALLNKVRAEGQLVGALSFPHLLIAALYRSPADQIGYSCECTEFFSFSAANT